MLTMAGSPVFVPLLPIFDIFISQYTYGVSIQSSDLFVFSTLPQRSIALMNPAKRDILVCYISTFLEFVREEWQWIS